jgi:hypothetical protein
MRGGSRSLAIVAGVLLVTAPVARAIVIGGGGSSRTDCLLALDAPVNDPPTKPKKVRCTDGDPRCDADGVVNGECVFQVGVCANSTFDPTHCTLSGVNSIAVDHALDNGDPKFDTDFQALQNRIGSQIETPTSTANRCTTPTNIGVRLEGPFPGDVCKSAKKQIKIVTLSTFQGGKLYKDTDKLKLTCDPPVPCEPRVIFGDPDAPIMPDPSGGTFKRIQKQIFNQSCALSGCHDSQTHQNEMVLEEGSAYAAIADVTPYNQVAAGRGRKRIDAANASSDTSFMYHKLTGDLDDKLLGERMPRDRGKLDQFLIDIVKLWIEAGAPQTGWVPGTD